MKRLMNVVSDKQNCVYYVEIKLETVPDINGFRIVHVIKIAVYHRSIQDYLCVI